MKLCIHHENFDKDVSSGTVHALYQWHELCMAFGVEELAVINETETEIKQINDSLPVVEYETLADFLDQTENHVFVEQGGEDYRNFSYDKDSWIIIGPSKGLPQADVSLPTKVALYPREAAAIILSEASWLRQA